MSTESLANGGMCMTGICGDRRRTEIDPAISRCVENLVAFRAVPNNRGLITVHLRKEFCGGLQCVDAFGGGQRSHNATMRRLNPRRLLGFVDKSICQNWFRQSVVPVQIFPVTVSVRSHASRQFQRFDFMFSGRTKLPLSLENQCSPQASARQEPRPPSFRFYC